MTSIVPYDDSNRQPEFFWFNDNRITIKYDSNNNPYFDGPEVCRAIGVSNPSMAYSRLDDDERTTLSQLEGESKQSGKSPVYVTESGLYNLILRSDKPEAKAFKKLVTSEILPAIRKTGSYSIQQLAPDEIIVMLAQQNVEARKRLELQQRQIEELHEIQASYAQRIEAVVDRLDKSDYFTVLQFCQRQGIKSTPAIRQMWGERASELSRERSVFIDKVIEGAYSVNAYHKSILQAVCVPKRKPSNQLPLLNTGS